MSLSSGFLGAQSRVDAGTKFEGALEELRVKYEKIAEAKEREEAERKAAEEAAAADSDEGDVDQEDDELVRLRNARKAELEKNLHQRREHLALGHGEYREIKEDEFLGEVTRSKFVVLHFYHREFGRCKIFDKHLRELAKKYIGTKFIHIDAEKSPFFVSKLNVKVLPTLVFFIDGITKHRQTGFEGLGDDDFPVRRLEVRLKNVGILGDAGLDVDSEGEEDELDEAVAGGRRDGATLAETQEAMRKKITASQLAMLDDMSDSDFED